MKLPFSFGLKKKEEKNYFLALLLQDEKVSAVVLQETAGVMHVAGVGEEHFSTSLEEADFDEWLSVVDAAVSTAEGSLPEQIQTEKTVFGVKQEWISEGKIKKGYLVRLKKICEELSLQPIGFLVFTEAILHVLQQEEGAPVSAILVELGKKFISISVIRAGRIIESKLIDYSYPPAYAVDQALKEFSVEILPSRIILTTTDEHNRVSQTFISHSWSKHLPFLHVPQVALLPTNFDIKSVLYGTAAQLGFTVTGTETLPEKLHASSTVVPENDEDKNVITDTQDKTPEEEATTEVKEENDQAEEQGEEDTELNGEAENTDEELPAAVSADYFGFVAGDDVARTVPQSTKKDTAKQPQMPDDEEVVQETQEFPEEIKDEETQAFSPTNFSTSATLLFSGFKRGVQVLTKQKTLKQLPQLAITSLGKTLPFLTSFLPKKSEGSRTRQTNVQMRSQDQETRGKLPFPLVWLVIPGMLLIIIGLWIWDMNGVSAKVNLVANPKVLENTQQVTFTTSGSSDFDNAVIAGQTVSVDESGSVSKSATGTKSVGTPAKGTVTIVNVDTSPASLSAGTTLTSSDGKKFTLDNSVNVPSGDVFSPGTATGTVTSAAIGPDYNLPSGTKFSIGSSNLIGAKNDAPLSGGTKKDIIIVAQADVDALSTTLIKNYEDKAQNDLKQQVGANKQLMPFFVQETLSQKTLNKNVGDEAQTVTLQATATYQSLTVDKADLTSYASHVLSIPDTMTLTAEGIQTDLTDTKQTKDTISGTLAMKASLLPKIDLTQTAQSIAGKSVTVATQMLQSLPQIAHADIVLSPSIPLFPKTVPHAADKIHISLSAQ